MTEVFRTKYVHYDGTNKMTHPSNEKNKDDILATLLKILDGETPDLKLLEIASGSGQHAGFFAPHFPNITYQPSEYDRDCFDSIKAYATDCPTKNIKEPIFVDISQDPETWEIPQKPGTYDYIYNCHLVQATPWNCSIGLFRAASKLLKPTGKMINYGPFAVDGVLEPESNVQFDAFLRNINPAYGVRDLTELRKLAEQFGMEMEQRIELPINNKIIVWKKKE